MEHFLVLPLAVVDQQNLLRNHTQHFDVDAVELVEARPGTAGRESLEELAHRNVVQTVGTVEHHALHRKSLGKIWKRSKNQKLRLEINYKNKNCF